jgi:glyoxylase-like metal-dependent hydrolase (beta-lactamase superfamily II)
MRAILPSIWTWSRFSEEKLLDFNGWYVQLPGARLLIDPPLLSEGDAAEIGALGPPELIVVTNKDHRRGAPEARARFGAPIAVHQADAALLGCVADRTFVDGDRLGGALEVLQVPHAKSPGESALWWRERRILFLGDALIGKPAGSLSLLPPEKFPDPKLARRGVERLRGLPAEAILVGDGVPIVRHGAERLDAFFGEGSETGERP